MARYLLDSDAFIDVVAGFAPSVAVVRQLRLDGSLLCTCSIVLAEVYSGLRPAQEQAAIELLDILRFLPTSAEAGVQAGRWRYEFARRGRPLQTPDVLIAATAAEHNAILVTANKKDFPMDGVQMFELPRPGRTPGN